MSAFDLNDFEPVAPADGCDGSPWCQCVDHARFLVDVFADEDLFDVPEVEPTPTH